MSPINVLINVALPVIILLGFSSEDRLGPLPALLLALALPFAWGVISLVRGRQLDVSTALGIISVLLTGVIAVFDLDTRLFAVKEAAIPFVFAIILLLSNRTAFPVVRLLAEAVLRHDRMNNGLDQRNARDAWHAHLVDAGTIWAGIMALSAVLKFIMASMIMSAPANTEQFNQQLAFYELVQLPTTFTLTGVLILSLLWFLANGASRHTGLPVGDVLRGGDRMARFISRFAPISNVYTRLVG